MVDSSSDCSYVAYIDESGELGTAFDRGSSEFLVMGAAIVPAWLPNIAADYFGHAHDINPKQIAPFPKFQKCGEKNKHVLTTLFPHYPIATVHVGIFKPALMSSYVGNNKNRLYAYLIKLTIERISWFIRDQAHPRDPNSCRCFLVFSENEALPYGSIRDYLFKLRHGGGNLQLSH
jgi:hypothetical protein